MQSKTAPEALQTDDPHTAGGKALIDMGHCIQYEEVGRTEWVTITPDQTTENIIDTDFVCEVVEGFGFSLVEVTARKAVFSRIDLG